MSKFETITYKKARNVGWITLNRPENLNVMNDKLRMELIQALELVREDSKVHLIVITGAGDRAFCAGADIGNFTKRSLANQLSSLGETTSVGLIRGMSKPVIAMVNGLALGIGCELVLACDIAIASEDAQLGLPEVRVGVIPGAGGTQVLPRLIGEKRAKELIFTGRTITAEEALRIGLVNQVVPRKHLRKATEDFVNVLLRRSPIILKFAKLAVNRALESNLSAGLVWERDLFAACLTTEDQKEGARAFLEKRQANYKGR